MSRILLSQADVTEVEEQFVLDALRSGWVAPLGPHVDAFEAEVAERVGVAGAVALSSGTAALHVALLGLGAKPGTAVVLPSMTFAASANAVVHAGATPVFVDSQMSDGNVDPQLLIDAVDMLRAEGTVVSAVMTVDLFGRCVEYGDIVRALDERSIPLVEDAAEALGATQDGIAAGAFGKAGVLSFNGNKIMTTSGGGMLLSDDTALLDRCRYLSTQARQPAPWYEHTEIGYNYRLSNILAALGRAQLTRLDEMIARRRAIRRLYAEGLGDLPGVSLLPMASERGDGEDNCWLTSIVLDPAQVAMSATSLIKELDAADIEARYLWKPMHLQPVFQESRSFINGTSEWLFANGVTLPSGPRLDDDDIQRVIQADSKRIGIRLMAAYRGKRALDLGDMLPALLVSLPVQVVVGAVVALKLGRPVLFRQLRPGLHGEPFELIKFRTMLPIDVDKGQTDDASRMTPTGRILRATSLDELPSLWNIVRGDMSVVGPRPLLMQYLERYTPEQARRHEVRPGLTGLAQVSGRNALSWEEKLALDVEYVDNASLRGDLRIIAMTVACVLGGKGVTGVGEPTKSEFMGITANRVVAA